jgi:hypothetical protein
MPERTFQDSSGIEWLVYDCTPRPDIKRGFARDYQAGWLCFQSATEKRRLVKYPLDWESYSVAQLEDLCEAAVIVSWVSPATGTPRLADDPKVEKDERKK